MTPRKLNVFLAKYCYAGNGGCQSMHPSLADWLVQTAMKAAKDERIDQVKSFTYSDTPITLNRNQTVKDARANGADVIVMLDNDNIPDIEPDGKPFWDTSFDFLYEHYDQGPVVIAAPYAGPPPIECIYVFEWRFWENREHHQGEIGQLSMLERNHAASLTGISTAAALPTGVSMWDIRCFDLLTHPYFDYEYEDETHSKKTGTEDVFTTRNVSMAGMAKLGYNPVFCNFDSWAGHAKPKIVRKPRVFDVKTIHESYKEAILGNQRHGIREMEIPLGADGKSRLPAMRAEFAGNGQH